MNKKRQAMAVVLALLAAIFYAINTPFSKILLNQIPPTMMAAFLYLGAGIGVGFLYLFHVKGEDKSERLTRKDFPYTIGMIVLDIAAPIFLMIGIRIGSASNASLLGNFEIVTTTLIALLVFKEKVTARLWAAIGFITVSSIVLSFEGSGSFQFSLGSLFVILATSCWGLENNCTRKISDKSTYEIVFLKGIFSGCGSLMISFILREQIPEWKDMMLAMLLGFVAYGLSIFMYIRAQKAVSYTHLDVYKRQIRSLFFQGEVDFNDEVLITNLRQKQALADAANSLTMVIESIENGMQEDFFTIDLKDAYTSLGFIIGEEIGDDLANEIFGKFCMGK